MLHYVVFTSEKPASRRQTLCLSYLNLKLRSKPCIFAQYRIQMTFTQQSNSRQKYRHLIQIVFRYF